MVPISLSPLKPSGAPDRAPDRAAAADPPRPAVHATELELPAARVITLRGRAPLPAVRAFRFPAGPISPAAQPAATTRPAPRPQPRLRAFDPQRATRTRLAPPQDVVRLKDRLYYLLQPPLEMLLSSQQLALPHDPFPYQLQGVAFLYTRHAAILADEMGLGKTMQAITAMRMLLHAGEVRSILLVCPKPLVTNWLRELHLWAPEVPVDTIGGDPNRRKWQWSREEMPLRIANYELLVRDAPVLAGTAPQFDLVVLDEAQRIKNPASSTSQVVRQLPRVRSWALTGTPIENSSADLAGIFEFLAAGYLSPSMSPRTMAKAVEGYILRRTKDDVLTDLPPKLFRDAVVDLTPQQESAYQRAEQEGVVELTALGDRITIQHVFELVLRLKQICNFDPATGSSGKLDRLEADLEEVVASGQKAIIFSQWVGALEHLAQILHRWGALEYHGRVPQRRRDQVLQQFRDDPSSHILLMSYGAGSVGLNLQFARYVFLFDRWWNPAVEDQAINRAHRIGASGPVTITRFTTRATIEERIEEILERKRQLFTSVMDAATGPQQLGLSQDEIFGLFHLRPAGRNAQAA